MTAQLKQPENFTNLGRSFETDVTRVVHSSLVMRPIYELESRYFRSGEEEQWQNVWKNMDLMWLAFAILDSISELTEYRDGATRREVIEKVLPLAKEQAKIRAIHAVEEDFHVILDRIFDHLANREKRYLPFEYDYFDGALRQFKRRKFWLIKTVFQSNGEEAVFTLTDEGYIAYFGLHETGALDATAIGNLRIKLLIERGNIDDAILVTEQNRKQCLRKAYEVRRIRRAIQRNIRTVDSKKIDALAEEGTTQATEVQKESQNLHHMVSENLQNLNDSSQNRKSSHQEIKMRQLAQNLERLYKQQLELVTELQKLPDDFYQNAHKLFRRRFHGTIPSLNEVMRRVCRMEESAATKIGEEFIAIFDPPVFTPLFNPASLIEVCERNLERQSQDDHRQLDQEIDGEQIERYESELTELLMKKAFVLIQDLTSEKFHFTMSELLKRSLEKDDPLLPIAVSMAIFQCVVDHHIAVKNGFQIERSTPEKKISIQLTDGRLYRGHELVIQSTNQPGVFHSHERDSSEVNEIKTEHSNLKTMNFRKIAQLAAENHEKSPQPKVANFHETNRSKPGDQT